MLNPSTSPLKSVFDLSQPSVSILNVQDGGITLFLKTNHGSHYTIHLLCRLHNLCEKDEKHLEKKMSKKYFQTEINYYIIKVLLAPPT